MNRPIWVVAALVLLPIQAPAELLSLPPDNVKDPARPSKGCQADSSLPFIYLEPHDCCPDLGGPIPVTLYAVNESEKTLNADWPAIVESLVLEPIGPGQVRPLGKRAVGKSAEIQRGSLVSFTVDLRDRFEIRGASVYRLVYARPLEDGRVHIATPVQFVIEDGRDIDKRAEALEAGPARDTFAALLKANPLFAEGVVPTLHWWNRFDPPKHPELFEGRWEKSYQAASIRWREGIKRLMEKPPPIGHVRAYEALLDRLMFLSDGFRCTPSSIFLDILDKGENNLSEKDQDAISLKLVKSRSSDMVFRSMNRLMDLKNPAVLDTFLAIADSPDKRLANKALDSLSNYSRNEKITVFLRRKMADPDSSLALNAAIVSCYSGDWSGFPLMLRCARSEDAALRLQAISQFVDSQFRGYSAKIVPVLLEELQKPTSDDHLERAIDSLSAYPSDKVLDAVTPFLKHKNTQVSTRAKLTIEAIQRDRNRNKK
jgi:hypothetical protein